MTQENTKTRPIWKIRITGTLLVLIATALCLALICLWPEQAGGSLASQAENNAVTNNSAAATQLNGPLPTGSESATASAEKPLKKLHMDQRVLLLVMIAGALGSFIHIGTSFAQFVGSGEFNDDWLWWYLLKPFISAALAVIFYLMLRGGLMAPTGDGAAVNIYGVVAMAGMVGMFSKQATTKLAEVFDTLFRAKGKPTTKTPTDNAPTGEVSASDEEVTKAGDK